jgi:hypothetical protein
LSDDSLHPAQNRGFRELVAATRHVIDHFEALAPRFDPKIADALNEGAELARELLKAVREAISEYDLHGGPAAQNVGKSGAGLRGGVTDKFLEKNQALRMAVLDVQHTVTLLAYLESVSGKTETEDLAKLCHDWHGKMLDLEHRMRAAVIVLGTEPDTAIEPVDSGVLGRAAHSVGYWVGTFGEWFDRRDAEKRSDS